jgi:ureidoglycolate lyase
MHVRADAAAFPVRLPLLERHFAHAQTYLPANGKPFVMVMGPPGAGDLPDWDALRAFVFRDCAGIALHPGTWHEFVYPLEDDTRLHVVLRAEAHLDTLARRQHPMDARGPDLHRIDLGHLAEILLAAPSPHDGEAHA